TGLKIVRMAIADESQADKAAVRAVVARASAAQSDPDEFLPLHTRDAIVVNLAGRRVFGRDALADAMTAALESPLSDVTTSEEVVDVRFPTPDVALVSCTKTVHDGRADADLASLPSAGALTYTMVRIGDEWLISHAQTTPVLG
ncbi:MAG: hypothetical protein QOJ72_756, partial [Nocardioidaceae bacterium]|nr:hypothetical protein [Nocardioidaceae bacterium]